MIHILADEGLNGNIVRALREIGFPVDWVLEKYPGISDREVIELAKANNQILITEDKDFGEWIFAHQIKGLTIIFLRYQKEEVPLILDFIVSYLNHYEKLSPQINEFITISNKKVRRRRI